MKRKILTLAFGLTIVLAMYLPAQAREMKNAASVVSANSFVALVSEVRYVRVRGRRYKVWYKVYYKKGRRYIRILRYQRA